MDTHVQGSFEAVVAELALLAPGGSSLEAAAGGGPSTSLRYARDDKGRASDDKGRASDDKGRASDDKGWARDEKACSPVSGKNVGVLRWGNALVTFNAGCAQAQPSEVVG